MGFQICTLLAGFNCTPTSMDMGIFECRYCNDETGAPAYDPRILLKVILDKNKKKTGKIK